MKCLEDLTGKVRRLAYYHTGGRLKVVINASEHEFDGRTRLCQAIAVEAKDWLEDRRDEEIHISGELVDLDGWLRQPATRLKVEFRDSHFVAELWQAEELMASILINDLETALTTIDGLAHKLLIWKK